MTINWGSGHTTSGAPLTHPPTYPSTGQPLPPPPLPCCCCRTSGRILACRLSAGDSLSAILLNKKSTLKSLQLCLLACPGLAVGGALWLKDPVTAFEKGGGAGWCKGGAGVGRNCCMTSSRESGSRRIGARASTDNGEKVDLLEAAILMTATNKDRGLLPSSSKRL